MKSKYCRMRAPRELPKLPLPWIEGLLHQESSPDLSFSCSVFSLVSDLKGEVPGKKSKLTGSRWRRRPTCLPSKSPETKRQIQRTETGIEVDNAEVDTGKQDRSSSNRPETLRTKRNQSDTICEETNLERNTKYQNHEEGVLLVMLEQ